MPLRLLPLLFSVLLGGCSTHHWGFGSLPGAPHNDRPTDLAKLEARSPDDEDRALHLLQLAFFEHLNGNFARSNQHLQQVKPMLAYLEATSITENVGAGVLNETLRSYSASTTERVLLHELAMLNFLFLGHLGSARVEALQADLQMQRLAEKAALAGQMASTRFVTGLVYEFNQEWDNALIAYRKARQILAAREASIPTGLERSLARMHQRLNLPWEGDAALLAPGPDLIVLTWIGQVSSKIQHQLRLYHPELRRHFAIALPSYPDWHAPVKKLSLRLESERLHSGELENLEHRVREDLSRQRPALVTAASARLVSKHKLADRAGLVNDFLGVLVDLVLTIGEVADLRSWNSLPAYIQLARHPIPTDESVSEPVHLQIMGRNVALTGEQTRLLLVHEPSQRIFTYPPSEESHDD